MSFSAFPFVARPGRSLAWDPAKGEVTGDAEASGLLRRPYRPPWVHPEPPAA